MTRNTSIRRIALASLSIWIGVAASDAIAARPRKPVPNGRVGIARLGPGCHYDTIGAALRAARSADAIYVREGEVFAESLVAGNTVLIQATDSPTCGLPSRKVTTRPIVRPPAGRAIEVLAGEAVSLAGLVLENGRATWEGGNAYVPRSASLNLYDCLVRGGFAGDTGGGIHSEGHLYLHGGTEVRDNQSWHGGGIALAGGTLELGEATIASNVAFVRGGGIDAVGAAILEMGGAASGLTIAANEGSLGGGGIHMDGGSLDLPHARFEDNFTNNGPGGGLAVATEDGPAAIGHAGSYFRNRANGPDGRGGGLSISGSYDAGVTLAALGDVAQNVAGTSGGGLYAAFAAITTDAPFEGNQAGSSGGGAALVAGSWTGAPRFAGNRAELSGGGLYVHGGDAKLDDVVVEANAAQSGGGVYVGAEEGYPGSFATARGSVVANTATQDGGGIAALACTWGPCSVSITDQARIEDNAALGYGGGIAIAGDALLAIEEAGVRRNHGDLGGGGVAALDDGTPAVPQLAITNPWAGGVGCAQGAASGTSLPAFDAYCTELRDNSSNAIGGGAHLEEATGSIQRTAFVNNSGGTFASGLAAGSGVDLLLANALFADQHDGSEVIRIGAGAQITARHLTLADNAGIPMRWMNGATGLVEASAIADAPMRIDGGVALGGDCNALFAAPVGGGTLAGSSDVGLTSAAFTTDPVRGRFQVSPGAPLLDERCAKAASRDIDNRARGATQDRGAFESP